MPEILRFLGLKFYIYTRDHESPHVHVVSPDGEAKFLVADEVTLIGNVRMKAKDIKLAESIIENNKRMIQNQWRNIHGNKDK